MIPETFRNVALPVAIVLLVVAGCPMESCACTSAIISADATLSGRPMLWKHRDTSATDNKVEYVAGEDGAYSYVALFNASDRKLEEAWTGMNQMGFAIMNTASYNIKDDRVPQKEMDKEGILMTQALRSCVTVDDFARLLDEYPRPMGVEANFGVIDAYGDGAFFETNNHSYVRYDLRDEKDGVLIRTNYSHSGRKGEGYGHIREANAEHILRPYIARRSLTPEVLTENASRNFYHDLRKADALDSSEIWIVDQDFIPRYKSTATIVIEGIKPLVPGQEIDSSEIISEYIMWTGLGYPPCAEIVPVWCHQEGVDRDLRGVSTNGTSPMCDKVKRRRSDVFSLNKGEKDKYFDRTKLRNELGTGYIQTLVPRNLEVYRLIKAKRDRGDISFPRRRSQ